MTSIYLKLKAKAIGLISKIKRSLSCTIGVFKSRVFYLAPAYYDFS
jgi:hypothetical protein